MGIALIEFDTICTSMKGLNTSLNQLKISDFEDKSLLIVDDDDPLRGRLSRAMVKKGFVVKEAKSVAEGVNMVAKNPPNFAVIDLRLEDGNGLDVVKELKRNGFDYLQCQGGYDEGPGGKLVSFYHC